MSSVTINFNTQRPNSLLKAGVIGSDAGRYLVNALQAAVAGTNQSNGITWQAVDSAALGDAAFLGPAIAYLAMSSGAGAVGGTVAGTLITVAHDGDDTTTSTALAAAIRASAAVNRRVTATNKVMVVSLASVTAGQYIDIGNIRFTAVSGTPAAHGEFDVSGADSADATSLALAINRHPALALKMRAVSNSSAVRVFLSTERTADPKWDRITNPGGFSTFTVSIATPTASVVTAVIAAVAGDIGNEVRLTASGTGMTAVTAGSAGFLGAGTGGGTLPYFLQP